MQPGGWGVGGRGHTKIGSREEGPRGFVLGSGLGRFFLDWCAGEEEGFLEVSITHKVLREVARSLDSLDLLNLAVIDRKGHPSQHALASLGLQDPCKGAAIAVTILLTLSTQESFPTHAELS